VTAGQYRRSAAWATAAWVVVTAAIVAVLIALAGEATRERVARNEARQVMKVLQPLLPPGAYDNEPDRDRIFIVEPGLLGSSEPLPLYRARRDGQPVAAVMTVIARQGYVGPIRLLVSLSADGTVLGAEAVSHQETPGLGDRIDAAKSNWMAAFTGRSLGDPAAGRWAVRRDGGEFDQLTGATITSRAVVNAVRDAARYFGQNRTEIFARPPE
jgi:electron transport complex protein RnfG